MRSAISASSSRGVKSTRRRTKLKRTPRTPASCRSRSSRSVTPRRTVATPRARPPLARHASAIARLSAPWQVACTTTLRAKPEVIAQREQLRLARVAGRVLPLGRVGKLRARDRTRGSARPPRRRRREPRLAAVARTSRASRASSRRRGTRQLCRRALEVIEDPVGLVAPVGRPARAAAALLAEQRRRRRGRPPRPAVRRRPTRSTDRGRPRAR